MLHCLLGRRIIMQTAADFRVPESKIAPAFVLQWEAWLWSFLEVTIA